MACSLFGGPSRRGDLEFLPAALEIVETPATPFARTLALLIAGAVLLAVIWTCWAQTDIVVIANGKIVPTGFSKTIQPLEIGIVRTINVEDGQAVRAGDLLIELDPSINLAERDRIADDLSSAQLDAARLRAMMSDDPLKAFEPPAGVSAEKVEAHRRLLRSQAAELHAKLDVLDDQYRAKQQELQTSKAVVDKIKAILPVVQTRTDIRKVLSDSGNGSKINYLEILQSLIDYQKELSVQEKKEAEIDAALVGLASTRRQTIAEQQRKSSEDLGEAERKSVSLSHDLERADQRAKFQQLRSPIDGVVQQLAIHTVGGVVTPAQTLLTIVPKEAPLEIAATMMNKDVGFVEEGQAVEIKVSTFNFTRYGLLTGHVKSVSRDSIAPDTSSGRKPAAPGSSDDDTTGGGGQEPTYAVRVSLDQTKIRADDRIATLGPGMTVTVEIKTGTRRLVSYVLSPLLRYGHDALRER